MGGGAGRTKTVFFFINITLIFFQHKKIILFSLSAKMSLHIKWAEFRVTKPALVYTPGP